MTEFPIANWRHALFSKLDPLLLQWNEDDKITWPGHSTQSHLVLRNTLIMWNIRAEDQKVCRAQIFLHILLLKVSLLANTRQLCPTTLWPQSARHVMPPQNFLFTHGSLLALI
ncbi:hypothetical protein Hypma_014452 [Hypsizygus marmoreus]|uniref:Uncharacterized protein n=1 Tax=Hypsizygus marmoreus TaxID=39966 RepID=A0A369JI54_HYPMA|nr:hypothetical protein Hypma_014452 [Hypsizygus marmoreus]